MNRISTASAAILSDSELIAKILAGENALFEHIIRRYNQRLFRIGAVILKNDQDAEDAMQSAYIKVYEHLAQFENRSSFGTWLTRIMVNECLAQKKKRMPHSANADQLHEKDLMITPDRMLINKELNRVLEDAIGKLPEKYRLVFVLREIEQMSVRDTSETLDIEQSNVKVRLNRAKTILRQNLNGYLRDQVYAFHLSRCDLMVNDVLTKLHIK